MWCGFVVRICARLVMAGAALVWLPAIVGAEEVKFDPEQLVGKWKYVSAEKGNEKSDPNELAKLLVEITKESWTLKGEDTFVLKYTLDITKTPIEVTFAVSESPFGGGATANGILELKDGELKLCYATMGGAAPTEFVAKEGSDARLIVLKKE